MFKFKDLFKPKNEKDIVEAYLADSISLEDLERRQRAISRGEAPWQVRANYNLSGWV
jgi:hypothetical protein